MERCIGLFQPRCSASNESNSTPSALRAVSRQRSHQEIPNSSEEKLLSGYYLDLKRRSPYLSPVTENAFRNTQTQTNTFHIPFWSSEPFAVSVSPSERFRIFGFFRFVDSNFFMLSAGGRFSGMAPPSS